MTDKEYFARRLKETDFESRGFSRENQVSGDYTDWHFGRDFTPNINFTICYDFESGMLSMYHCDPTEDLTTMQTKRVLWRILVFTTNELDFLLNRCTEYQAAVGNFAWRLQKPPIAEDGFSISGSFYRGSEQYPASPMQIAIQHGLPIRGDLVWKDGYRPTVEFQYNPNGELEFDRESILPEPKDESEVFSTVE